MPKRKLLKRWEFTWSQVNMLVNCVVQRVVVVEINLFHTQRQCKNRSIIYSKNTLKSAPPFRKLIKIEIHSKLECFTYRNRKDTSQG